MHTEEKKPKKCTIYDVARLAKVSPSTVSHSLNGTATISEATKARIMDAVRQLGYRPNANARTLRQSRSRLLGIVVPDISCEYYASCIAGIIQQAKRDKYVVLANDLQYDAGALEGCVSTLIDRCVDGLIFIGGAQDEQYIQMAVDSGIPVVLGDRKLEGYPCVEFNNRETMRKLVRSLYGAGYRRFSYIGEALERQQNLGERYSGFAEGIQDCGVPRENVTVVFEDSLNFGRKFSTSRQFFRGFFSAMDRSRLPEVLLTSNDMIAIGALRAALDVGLRVPEELSIVGFDNISMTEFGSPSVTTVDQSGKDLGGTCYQMMMRLIRGEACGDVLLKQKIAVRSSAHIPAECLRQNDLELVTDGN